MTFIHSARHHFMRAVLAFASALFVLPALPALAAAPQAFDEAAFRKAQRAGKTILVYVHAEWCVACAKQKPILERLGKDKAFEQVVRFNVDFDKPGNALNILRATSQATLIVFKGDKEIARSTFDTNPDSIRAMLAKGV